jgi:hypothetical protein
VEYLLILGAVLVIAVVVVTLLGSIPSMSKDTSDTQSRLYWHGQAKPFSVIDSAYVNSTACEGGGKGLVLAMKNTEKYVLTLTGAYIGGNSSSVCLYQNATSSVQFAPGEEKLVGVVAPAGSQLCTNRRSDSFEFDLLYNSPYITNKLQVGDVNMHVNC